MNLKNITVNLLLQSRVETPECKIKVFEGASGWSVLHGSGLTTYHLKSDLNVEPTMLERNEYTLLQTLIKTISISTTRLLRLIWDKLLIGVVDNCAYTPSGYIENVLDVRGLTSHYTINRIDAKLGLVSQEDPNVVVRMGTPEYLECVTPINDLLESQVWFDRQYASPNWYDLRLYKIHNEQNLMYDLRGYLIKHYPSLKVSLVKLPDLSSRLTFNDVILTCEHGGSGIVKLSTVLDIWRYGDLNVLKSDLKDTVGFVAYLNQIVLVERSLHKATKKGMSDDK